jgi:hypothetical protein
MKFLLPAMMAGFIAVAGLSEPKITGVVPDKPAVAAKPLQVTVNGEDFRAGLTLMVTTPGGQVRNFAGADIVNPRPTTFSVSLAFDALGTYEFVVMNTDGGKSPPFRIQSQKASKAPFIDRIEPVELSRSPEPQVITLIGGNFEAGVKVSVTDPTGTVTVRDTIDRLEPQRLVLRLPFETSGTYALMVTNVSGTSSNSVAINIR